MADDPTAHRFARSIQVQQIGTAFRTVAWGVVPSAAAAWLLAGAIAWLGSAHPGRDLAWAAFVSACAGAHLLLRRGWGRSVDGGKRWGRAYAAASLLEGMAWGWASVEMAPGDRYDLQLMVMLVAYANAAGAIPTFGSFMPAFWCFFLPATLPFVVRNATGMDPEHVALTALALLFVVGMASLAMRSHAEFTNGLRLRLEVEELAADLARQKARAEQANLDKSRFLAAASHDLRQPVHALGLFVGALAGMALPAEARTLVGHLTASVQALDSLFNALLDISRLDAGVVTPEELPFALGPLLERVCRDCGGEARAKGLDLRLVPCNLGVRTDPVLLERVLRNLVGNAVRHTELKRGRERGGERGGERGRERGRVLVGCRRHDGTVAVEVWDTGPGIAPALQGRVFDEFFQVGNPERDRGKGLGLGLAIVRRLTTLLGLPLEMRSQPGVGTRFRVVVPVSAVPAAHAPLRDGGPAGPSSSPNIPPAESSLILVIDDESAIRDGMRTLLAGWGHQVIAAASGDEMLHAVADCPVVPGLLICDQRLPGGESGIDVVRRLQSEYNNGLPALLVTGDTAPERLAEARASGLVLLHKPVEHGLLRELVDAALREREEADAE